MSMEFGRWLKERRQAAGLTQEAVARHVGCSKVHISKLENGASFSASGVPYTPRLELVEQLAEAVGAPVNEARAAAGYATASQETPKVRRAMAMFQELDETWQDMVIDAMSVLLGEDSGDIMVIARQKRPTRRVSGNAKAKPENGRVR